MPSAVNFANMIGEWTGINRLWLMPGDPAHESPTSLSVAQGVRAGFTSLHYTWSEGGEAQEGILVIGPLADANAIQAQWIDTFHTGGGFMAFSGAIGADGMLILNGSYSVGDSPVWGWQIRLAPMTGSEFHLTMYNLSPEGEEYPAVEAVYTRKER